MIPGCVPDHPALVFLLEWVGVVARLANRVIRGVVIGEATVAIHHTPVPAVHSLSPVRKIHREPSVRAVQATVVDLILHPTNHRRQTLCVVTVRGADYCALHLLQYQKGVGVHQVRKILHSQINNNWSVSYKSTVLFVGVLHSPVGKQRRTNALLSPPSTFNKNAMLSPGYKRKRTPPAPSRKLQHADKAKIKQRHTSTSSESGTQYIVDLYIYVYFLI